MTWGGVYLEMNKKFLVYPDDIFIRLDSINYALCMLYPLKAEKNKVVLWTWKSHYPTDYTDHYDNWLMKLAMN